MKFHKVLTGITFATGLVLAASAQAGWGVAEGSSVGYVSIKNNSIAENNRFTVVTGSISDDGEIAVSVDLASVETNVDIRNQRMRDVFFDVANHPQALISANLTPVELAQIEAGAPIERTVALTVSLHGSEATVDASLRAVSIGGQLYVTTLEPILISAADFGLGDGVAMLQKLAGLNAIANVIPVTVDLRLVND